MGITNEEKNDLISYRLEKAEEVYREAVDVAGLKHWNLAVNRLYYAIFHACNGLLLKADHNARTHSGIIRMVMLHYVKTGKLTEKEGELITTLFNMRQTGDYSDLFDWKQTQVEPLIEPTRQLLTKLIDLTR